MLWTKHRFNIVQQRILLSKKIEGMLPSGKSMLWSAVGLIQLQSSNLQEIQYIQDHHDLEDFQLEIQGLNEL